MTAPLTPPGNPFTQAWAIGTLDRILGTFLAAFVALIGLGQPGFDLLHVNWKGAAIAAASATVITFVKSLLAGFIGDPGTTNILPGGK